MSNFASRFLKKPTFSVSLLLKLLPWKLFPLMWKNGDICLLIFCVYQLLYYYSYATVYCNYQMRRATSKTYLSCTYIHTHTPYIIFKKKAYYIVLSILRCILCTVHIKLGRYNFEYSCQVQQGFPSFFIDLIHVSTESYIVFKVFSFWLIWTHQGKDYLIKRKCYNRLHNWRHNYYISYLITRA